MKESEKILNDVQLKIKELELIVKKLPAGYRYKVKELGSCIETVVSMYNDIQNGIIPDILKEMRDESNQAESLKEPSNIVQKGNSQTLVLGDIKI